MSILGQKLKNLFTHRSLSKQTASPRPSAVPLMEGLEPRLLMAADFVISEFMASNNNTLDDEDGNSSDWIEIHNAGNQTASLNGWHLTDDAAILNKWTFPDISLAPNEYRIIFASGKDRTDPQSELHTNFSLNASGEFLGLVQSDGVTIKQAFDPEYPEQYEDVSYGFENETLITTLVDTNSPVNYLVPSSSADLTPDWFDTIFDDTSWTPATLDLGYDAINGPGGGIVQVNHALNGTASQSSTNAGNLANLAIDGNLGNFTHTLAGDTLPATWLLDLGEVKTINDVVLHNRDSCCASRLRDITVQLLADDGQTVLYQSALLNPENVLSGSLLNIGPDQLSIDLVTETGDTIDARFISIVRTPDPDNSGVSGDLNAGPSEADVLSLGEVQVFGPEFIPPDFNTNLESEMFNQNASVLARIPFDATDVQNFSQLNLDITYDDGFVGYLNGVEILRRNAPDTLTFDASADVGLPELPPPSDISNMALWLRNPASNFNPNTGVWSDSSGNANHASPVGFVGGTNYIAPTPSQGTNANLFSNSFSAVRFNGQSNDMLVSSGLNGNVGLNELTIFTVYRTFGAGANLNLTRAAGFGSYAANGATGANHFNLASDPSIRKDNGAITGHSSAQPVNEFFIRVSRMDGSGVDEWFNADGTLNSVLTNAGTQFTTSNDNFYLGDLRAGVTPVKNATSLADIEVAEVVVYNASLSDTQVLAVNDWLEVNVGNSASDLNPTTESIDLSQHLDLIQEQGNVLAFHGLNINQSDNDFLLIPQLSASQIITNNLKYLTDPTPGTTNTTGFLGFVADTRFDIDRGFYTEAFDVTITSSTPGASIIYTTDGSLPSATNGTIVNAVDDQSSPAAVVNISTTTTLRAAAYKPGHQPSNTDTHTYLFLDHVKDQGTNPPGFPTSWNGVATNYEVDPNVTGNPLYADTFTDDLRSIPTLSIAMDVEDLFGTNGIYANPQGRGIEWERLASFEYILPDGSTGFQEDAGLRIFGFSSRNPNVTPKHSLRMKFKSEYGDAKLNYPLFADSEVERFDDIVLRATNAKSFNDNRGNGWNEQAQYQRDTWARDTMRDMGQPTSHATYVHLYLNGLYWGLYNAVERPDADYMSEYFGGEDTDYDALNTRTGTLEVVDGTIDAWETLIDIVEDPSISTPQGWLDVQQYLNVENMIDWFNTYFYGGARDWVGTNGNNMRVARERAEGAGFIAFPWDFENSFWDATDNNTNVTNQYDTLGKVHNQLMTNPEYRLLFADRVHQHYFNDGALTPEKAAERWMIRAAEIDRAIVGESARWGDTRFEPPRTRDVEWLTEQNRLITQYFPFRGDVLLDQFRGLDLYPDLNAPEFAINGNDQHGGETTIGDNLSMFVLDSQIFIDTTLLAQGDPVFAHVPTDDSLGLSWTQPGFVVPALDWTDGTTGSGVGYDNDVDYDTLIQTDIGADILAKNSASVLIRQTFQHDDTTTFDSLVLKMRYDDGFVAYLNGTLVTQSTTVTNSTPGSATAGPNESSGFEQFDISAFEHLLVDGTNVLAIHGINTTISSSDLLILPELVGSVIDVSSNAVPIWYTTDGTDPRLEGGAINPNATLYNGQFPLDESVQVKARALVDGEWSAITNAGFVVDVPIRVSEIHYNPDGSDDAEFIEILNTSNQAIDLTGVHFTMDLVIDEGIIFDFLDTDVNKVIQPGERMVIARDLNAFAAAHPEVPAQLIADRPFQGALNNAGEQITLRDKTGGIIQQFSYSDDAPWDTRPDGNGPSLDFVNPAASKANWNDATSWRASGINGGTPGRPDPVGVARPGDFNYNGIVNIQDLALLASNFGKSVLIDPSLDIRWQHGDANNDGVVNISDLALLASNFGKFGSDGFPTVGAAAVDLMDFSDSDTSIGKISNEAILLINRDDEDASDSQSWNHIGNLLIDEGDDLLL